MVINNTVVIIFEEGITKTSNFVCLIIHERLSFTLIIIDIIDCLVNYKTNESGLGRFW